jgi:ABC-type sugar transport system substrate-binding protein
MTALAADMDRIIDMHRPDILMMVPSPSRPFMELFQKWFDKFGIPLMTIDTEFFSYNFFRERNLKVPPIVQIDNAEGGRMAAEMLMERLPEQGQKLQYLVMPGLEDAPHSQARIHGFQEAVITRYPDARIRILPPGNFRRQKARKVFEDFLEDADLSRYQGIFCCNDEMAVGVYTALSTTSRKTSISHKFSIVGFNNTTEMQNAMLVEPDGMLIGTIDQNLSDYTETVFTVIDRLLKGEAVEERYLIKPVSIRAKQ